MNLRVFDELASKKVSSRVAQEIDGVIEVLRGLIISEKIFSIYTFNQTIKELSEIGLEFAQRELSLDSEVFIENLREFLSRGSDQTDRSFGKCNMAQEYDRINKQTQTIFTAKEK